MEEQIQLLVRLLVSHGLEHAFGVTGSGASLALITELEDAGVQYHPVAHEAAAALMAGAVCRATGNLSISIAIKGPGLANMIPGIVHNHFENNPTLSVAEAYGSGVPSYRKHKRLDHTGMLSPIVKGTVFLNKVAERLPLLLQTARSEVPGPVHLELCTKGEEPGTALPLSDRDMLPPSREIREKVGHELRKSKRPILIVGSLALRRDWKEKLATLNVPTFTTASAKGVLDERLAHSAGVFTGDGKGLSPELHLFTEADFVVGIGLRNTEVLSPRPFDKVTVLLDELDGKLTEGFQPDILLSNTTSEFVSDVLEELKGKSWGLDRLDFLRREMCNALLDDRWLPSVCFDVLNRLDFPYTLVLDTGSFCTIGEHLWQAGPSRYFLGSSNDRYMGVAIPCAVGVGISKPGLPVFCVVGDGGMRTYPAEIKLAVQERLPLCFILMTDGRYGSVVNASQRNPISQRAVTIFQPSWWQSVEAMGCEAKYADTASSFEAVIHKWSRRGPLFIEAPFDPESYVGMTRQLR